MKASKLIKRLQQLLQREGDIEVGIHTPDYGNYVCAIDNVRAGVDGTLNDADFGVASPEEECQRILVIFRKH